MIDRWYMVVLENEDGQFIGTPRFFEELEEAQTLALEERKTQPLTGVYECWRKY